MPRNSKASRILNDAEMRLEAARMRRHTAQSQLNSAIATHDALQEAYDALERELAPKPRARVATAASAQTGPAKPATTKAPKAEPPLVLDGTPCTAKVPGLDVVCGETSDKLIHDPNGGYAGYHPFEASAPAQGVEKRSRRKAAVTSSTVSSEIEMAAALSASGD